MHTWGGIQMAQKSKGMRRKTRKKLTKQERGGEIADHLQAFEDGEQVRIAVNPSVHDGMPHPRFHGRIATVVGRQGRSYRVQVPDANAEKTLIVYPAHLQPV